MESIETHFRISYLNGKSLAYYYNKEEFINDCQGIKDLEFSSEIFQNGSILKWQNKDLKIDEIIVQFSSILMGGERIVDDKDRISKTIVIVVIFIED